VLQETGSREFPRVSIPDYDRAALRPGIVHIGVGAFHRAHQLAYLDRLAACGASADWGVIGIGLRSGGNREALLRQDCLFSLLERSADEDRVRVIGSLLDYLDGREHPKPARAAMADARTKVVTLTVTRQGYEPESVVPGYLAEALRLRRERGIPPFTVLSCDNLPENGRTARDAVLAHARERDEDLAGWIEREVSFPSTVVDRITPATGDEHRELLERDFDIRDRAPVVCEDYVQWIVEDDFPTGRPPLEEVGVRFVADVTSFELQKKRLLNGSHTALGFLGRLAGHEGIDDAIDDPPLRGFVEAQIEEIAALLPRGTGFDLDEYGKTLMRRFANPRIGDRLERLSERGSTKVPDYLLPSLREAVEAGTPHENLTLALAGWVRCLTGTDTEGGEIELDDARIDDLRPLARQAAEDPRPLLRERDIFGDLGDDGAFVDRLRRTLHLLDELGPAGAAEACSGSREAIAA
jgi:fructuronate reductase/mannitol 2-dehydrogenase